MVISLEMANFSEIALKFSTAVYIALDDNWLVLMSSQSLEPSGSLILPSHQFLSRSLQMDHSSLSFPSAQLGLGYYTGRLLRVAT